MSTILLTAIANLAQHSEEKKLFSQLTGGKAFTLQHHDPLWLLFTKLQNMVFYKDAQNKEKCRLEVLEQMVGTLDKMVQKGYIDIDTRIEIVRRVFQKSTRYQSYSNTLEALKPEIEYSWLQKNRAIADLPSHGVMVDQTLENRQLVPQCYAVDLDRPEGITKPKGGFGVPEVMRKLMSREVKGIRGNPDAILTRLQIIPIMFHREKGMESNFHDGFFCVDILQYYPSIEQQVKQAYPAYDKMDTFLTHFKDYDNYERNDEDYMSDNMKLTNYQDIAHLLVVNPLFEWAAFQGPGVQRYTKQYLSMKDIRKAAIWYKIYRNYALKCTDIDYRLKTEAIDPLLVPRDIIMEERHLIDRLWANAQHSLALRHTVSAISGFWSILAFCGETFRDFWREYGCKIVYVIIFAHMFYSGVGAADIARQFIQFLVGKLVRDFIDKWIRKFLDWIILDLLLGKKGIILTNIYSLVNYISGYFSKYTCWTKLSKWLNHFHPDNPKHIITLALIIIVWYCAPSSFSSVVSFILDAGSDSSLYYLLSSAGDPTKSHHYSDDFLKDKNWETRLPIRSDLLYNYVAGMASRGGPAPRTEYGLFQFATMLKTGNFLSKFILPSLGLDPKLSIAGQSVQKFVDAAIDGLDIIIVACEAFTDIFNVQPSDYVWGFTQLNTGGRCRPQFMNYMKVGAVSMDVIDNLVNVIPVAGNLTLSTRDWIMNGKGIHSQQLNSDIAQIQREIMRLDKTKKQEDILMDNKDALKQDDVNDFIVYKEDDYAKLEVSAKVDYLINLRFYIANKGVAERGELLKAAKLKQNIVTQWFKPADYRDVDDATLQKAYEDALQIQKQNQQANAPNAAPPAAAHAVPTANTFSNPAHPAPAPAPAATTTTTTTQQAAATNAAPPAATNAVPNANTFTPAQPAPAPAASTTQQAATQPAFDFSKLSNYQKQVLIEQLGGKIPGDSKLKIDSTTDLSIAIMETLLHTENSILNWGRGQSLPSLEIISAIKNKLGFTPTPTVVDATEDPKYDEFKKTVTSWLNVSQEAQQVDQARLVQIQNKFTTAMDAIKASGETNAKKTKAMENLLDKVNQDIEAGIQAKDESDKVAKVQIEADKRAVDNQVATSSADVKAYETQSTTISTDQTYIEHIAEIIQTYNSNVNTTVSSSMEPGEKIAKIKELTESVKKEINSRTAQEQAFVLLVGLTTQYPGDFAKLSIITTYLTRLEEIIKKYAATTKFDEKITEIKQLIADINANNVAIPPVKPFDGTIVKNDITKQIDDLINKHPGDTVYHDKLRNEQNKFNNAIDRIAKDTSKTIPVKYQEAQNLFDATSAAINLINPTSPQAPLPTVTWNITAVKNDGIYFYNALSESLKLYVEQHLAAYIQEINKIDQSGATPTEKNAQAAEALNKMHTAINEGIKSSAGPKFNVTDWNEAGRNYMNQLGALGNKSPVISSLYAKYILAIQDIDDNDDILNGKQEDAGKALERFKTDCKEEMAKPDTPAINDLVHKAFEEFDKAKKLYTHDNTYQKRLDTSKSKFDSAIEALKNKGTYTDTNVNTEITKFKDEIAQLKADAQTSIDKQGKAVVDRFKKLFEDALKLYTDNDNYQKAIDDLQKYHIDKKNLDHYSRNPSNAETWFTGIETEINLLKRKHIANKPNPANPSNSSTTTTNSSQAQPGNGTQPANPANPSNGTTTTTNSSQTQPGNGAQPAKPWFSGWYEWVAGRSSGVTDTKSNSSQAQVGNSSNSSNIVNPVNASAIGNGTNVEDKGVVVDHPFAGIINEGKHNITKIIEEATKDNIVNSITLDQIKTKLDEDLERVTGHVYTNGTAVLQDVKKIENDVKKIIQHSKWLQISTNLINYYIPKPKPGGLRFKSEINKKLNKVFKSNDDLEDKESVYDDIKEKLIEQLVEYKKTNVHPRPLDNSSHVDGTKVDGTNHAVPDVEDEMGIGQQPFLEIINEGKHNITEIIKQATKDKIISDKRSNQIQKKLNKAVTFVKVHSYDNANAPLQTMKKLENDVKKDIQHSKWVKTGDKLIATYIPKIEGGKNAIPQEISKIKDDMKEKLHKVLKSNNDEENKEKEYANIITKAKEQAEEYNRTKVQPLHNSSNANNTRVTGNNKIPKRKIAPLLLSDGKNTKPPEKNQEEPEPNPKTDDGDVELIDLTDDALISKFNASIAKLKRDKNSTNRLSDAKQLAKDFKGAADNKESAQRIIDEKTKELELDELAVKPFKATISKTKITKDLSLEQLDQVREWVQGNYTATLKNAEGLGRAEDFKNVADKLLEKKLGKLQKVKEQIETSLRDTMSQVKINGTQSINNAQITDKDLRDSLQKELTTDVAKLAEQKTLMKKETIAKAADHVLENVKENIKYAEKVQSGIDKINIHINSLPSPVALSHRLSELKNVFRKDMENIWNNTSIAKDSKETKYEEEVIYYDSICKGLVDLRHDRYSKELGDIFLKDIETIKGDKALSDKTTLYKSVVESLPYISQGLNVLFPLFRNLQYQFSIQALEANQTNFLQQINSVRTTNVKNKEQNYEAIVEKFKQDIDHLKGEHKIRRSSLEPAKKYQS
jgi:hypothetical protein